jgi:hypothetical protein
MLAVKGFRLFLFGVLLVYTAYAVRWTLDWLTLPRSAHPAPSESSPSLTLLAEPVLAVPDGPVVVRVTYRVAARTFAKNSWEDFPLYIGEKCDVHIPKGWRYEVDGTRAVA